MKNRSDQKSSTFPRMGSGVDQRGIIGGGGGSEVIKEGHELRQWHGQVGGVNGSHTTALRGNDTGDHGSHQNHTHSQNSPPTAPLTSIPRKKHSDNSKPINIAVYSAPLSPHSEEKVRELQSHPPTANNSSMPRAHALQNVGGQSSLGGKSYQYSHMTQDHAPLFPRQPPSGYDQSHVKPQNSYPLTPPPLNVPHPYSSSTSQPSFSRPEFKGHRRSASSGYGSQSPSSVAMVTQRYGRSSLSSQTPVVNHSFQNQNEVVPTFNRQLSTKSLHGYPISREETTSFNTPALPSHNHTHNCTPSSPQLHVSIPPNPFHTSQDCTQAPTCTSYISNPDTNSASLSLLSLQELPVDIEAQPTPEMLLSRPHLTFGHDEINSGAGMGLLSVTHSHSNLQQVHWSGSQASLSMSHSSSRTGDSNKVPKIQVDALPSTLVTSSTRTQPTAAINDGGSPSPLRRKRMGHSRNLSLGNNVPQHRPTHARNRSLGSVTFNHILPPSTLSSHQGSLGNLSLLSHATSKTGSRLSLTSGFLSEAQVPQTPDPDNGYDFVQHFNLFSQYTSNMALEYYTARREGSTHQPTTPPVWCMDVWNRIVVVGCGNGQIEVCAFITHALFSEYCVHGSGMILTHNNNIIILSLVVSFDDGSPQTFYFTYLSTHNVIMCMQYRSLVVCLGMRTCVHWLVTKPSLSACMHKQALVV